MHAEELTARDVLGFTWRERWQLLRFLRWTAEMDTGGRKQRQWEESDAG